jgi:hypothetical protein
MVPLLSASIVLFTFLRAYGQVAKEKESFFAENLIFVCATLQKTKQRGIGEPSLLIRSN